MIHAPLPRLGERTGEGVAHVDTPSPSLSPPSGGEEHEGCASLRDIPQDETCQLSMSLVSGKPAASPSTWWPIPAPTRNAS